MSVGPGMLSPINFSGGHVKTNGIVITLAPSRGGPADKARLLRGALSGPLLLEDEVAFGAARLVGGVKPVHASLPWPPRTRD